MFMSLVHLLCFESILHNHVNCYNISRSLKLAQVQAFKFKLVNNKYACVKYKIMRIDQYSFCRTFIKHDV